MGLVEHFPLADNVAPRADLDALLATLLDRARRAWPAIAIDDAVFVARLAECVVGDPEGLARIAVEDVYLAQGMLARQPAALAVFEQQIVPDIQPSLRTIDPSPAFADEIVQLLRHKLLIDEGGGPRLVRYFGTGPLAGWIRIVALRLGVDHRRQTWRERPLEDDLLAGAEPVPSPEHALAKLRHDELVREALRDAVLAQSSKTRALLRFYYGDGVGVEDLGALYHVHASTISRWLAKARDELLAHTRTRLAATLRIGEAEVDSMLGHSLDVSLDSLLETQT